MTKLIDITMPSLGSDMTEGMLTEWLVDVGDQVHNGQVIAVLETHKGAIDMEVYYDGIISELLIMPITSVPVGTVLAKLELSREVEEPILQSKPQKKPIEQAKTMLKPEPKPVPKQERKQGLKPESKQQSIQDPEQQQTPADISAAQTQNEEKGQSSKSRIIASPAAKTLAADNAIDLSTISGSGLYGAVILKDLEPLMSPLSKSYNSSKLQTTKSKQHTSVSSAESDPLINMRKAIAAAMVKSKQRIPHFYVNKTINVNNAQQWLQQINQQKSPKEHILLIAILLKAIALTLKKYPELNGFYLNQQLEKSVDINIANVISLRTGGVVVPALSKVDQLSIAQIMTALQDVTTRARGLANNSRLRSSELMAASITVTNMGDRGADNVFGVIYPPQVAIIGLGKVQQVPQVSDTNVVVGEQLTVSLSADHRVIDGMLASKFLNTLDKKLQKPERL